MAFTLATSIFRDPRIQVMFDEWHSAREERWIGLGMASSGCLQVVVYTWMELDPLNVRVRIVSARSATAAEERAYEDSL